MDLVALESEHEAKYFIKVCEKNAEILEKFSHIGGVQGHENWFWITSNQQVNFDLKLTIHENKEKEEENCLQLVKTIEKMSFGRTNCFGVDLRKFVCEKVIKNKLERRWEILS